MNIAHRAFQDIKPSGSGGKVASWAGCGKELTRILGPAKWKWKTVAEVDHRGKKTGRMTQIFEEI